ncbi:AraC family transcriptional regulator N-terminal domain-containing protein [Rhizosaccharibacter radicis]|uniref:AraC family transcriptional regulator n=1 Tax=Rhizosaccharibacter radicis TaxID=2782605 RepID=A0ABT1VZZ2_9PROT|nr:AraC family transcriptional regulator [Acetobacteraceae bacterium KSS12]
MSTVTAADEAAETERLRFRIAQQMNRHLEASHDTGALPLPGFSFHRRASPADRPSPCFLKPCLTFIVRGARRVTLAGRTFEQGEADYLLTEVGLPTAVQVLQASPERPYLSIKQEIDFAMTRDLIADIDRHRHDLPPGAAAATTAAVTVPLAATVLRLVELLDAPRDIPILASALQRELIYRILTGPVGPRLRRAVRLDAGDHGVAAVLRCIRSRFDEPLRIGMLAGIAGMGQSTLHHRFRSLTGMTPLQYQKQLRLFEAQRLMLTERLDAAVAAHRVGYESASQFNRDYRRQFEAPPGRDTRIRASLADRHLPSPTGRGTGSGKKSAGSV